MVRARFLKPLAKVFRGSGRVLKRAGKVGKKLIPKKGKLKYAALLTAAGVTGSYVSKYKAENNGCFLYDGRKKCKVVGLSCCNREVTADVPACVGFVEAGHDCDDRESTEEGCCRGCDGAGVPGKVMKCERATTTDALTNVLGKSMWDGIGSARYIVIVLALFFGLIFFNRLRRAVSN